MQSAELTLITNAVSYTYTYTKLATIEMLVAILQLTRKLSQFT